jgi:cytochrome c556
MTTQLRSSFCAGLGALLLAACGSADCPESSRAATAQAVTWAPADRPDVVRPSERPELPHQVGELTRDERAALRPQMMGHGETMEDLLWASLMLDVPSIATIASWIERGILADPTLAEGDAAPADDSAVGADYPVAFVWLQAKLARDAQALARASLDGDRDEIARAYGRVAEGCIACHARYLPKTSYRIGKPPADAPPSTAAK